MMRSILAVAFLLTLDPWFVSPLSAQPVADKLRSLNATEAHQAVATHKNFLFAIANREIGKYEKQSGKHITSWQATSDSPLRHLNSGTVFEGKLFCAHSTWPEKPAKSSVEIWDCETLTPIGSHPFPPQDGALTWVDFYQGSWWGVFAHYGTFEEVDRTTLVQFDEHWQIKKTWKFPPEVIQKFLPYSCSGGSWGPDGLLYTTGHDRKECYVLKVSDSAKELELSEILSLPIPGQGISWDHNQPGTLYGIDRKQKALIEAQVTFNDLTPELLRWLQPQQWERDTPGPILSLGQADSFDDTHIFAPCVATKDNLFHLWYCGSTGTVANRVFKLGLATSPNGREFHRHSIRPVHSFGDGTHSILTPTLLKDTLGHAILEQGKMRMWFSSTNFTGSTGLHTLHEATSSDGVTWSTPSAPQLKNVYAPSILKVGNKYLLWYTDVSTEPWVMRHAVSNDGLQWQVHKRPVLTINQPWERNRLFYPTVVFADDHYLMWYGSYWKGQKQKTAIGFAISKDGIHWHKHPQNPILRPQSTRPWESHYTTSQSVMRLADGSWRIWYASRKKPPFTNKYYAINTAHWSGPQ